MQHPRGILLSCLFGALVGLSAPRAQAQSEPQAPKQTLFFYIQGNPAGLALTYDLELPRKGPISLGFNLANYVFAGAGELSLRYRYLGGLIDVLAGAGVEAGGYLQPTPGQPLPQTFEQAGPRKAGIKEFARAEAKLNLKLDKLWIYGRISPTARWRDFVELDNRRAVAVDDEFSLGSAAALLVRVWGDPADKDQPSRYARAGWAYAEYTRETVTAFESDDPSISPGKFVAINRPSVGLIGYAPFGWERVTYNLDLYYSLADENLFPGDESLGIGGPGAQLFVWVSY
jgi:hypothetical protein